VGPSPPAAARGAWRVQGGLTAAAPAAEAAACVSTAHHRRCARSNCAA
jgi:hypothetical protein